MLVQMLCLATEHLIGEGVQPEHLNDDRLGRALDKFYQVGVTQLFTNVVMGTAKQFGVKLPSIHLDSGSFHVDGEYLPKPSQDFATETTCVKTPPESSSPQEPEADKPKTINIDSRNEKEMNSKHITVLVLCQAKPGMAGSSGLCGLPIFLACAHSWRKQSTGYAASCRDTEIH